jgi:hypothetical protein
VASAESEEPVGSAESVESVEQAESAALAELAAGIVFPRFRPVGGTAATGSITRNIAVVPPIVIGLLPIALVERRAVIHSRTARARHGNKLVAKAGIWGAIARAEELA